MKRRTFITLIGGVAAWPLAARAQQTRLIGVLISIEENDPEAQARATAFRQGMQELGWIDGRNVRIDYRYVAGDIGRAERYAAEIVAQGADVIVANSSVLLAAVQRQTRTVRAGCRSCWRRVRREFEPPGRQYHRLHHL